jgi:hypothetical protein
MFIEMQPHRTFRRRSTSLPNTHIVFRVSRPSDFVIALDQMLGQRAQ